MVSIARKNLFEDIPRFLVAQAGIMFAVSLVTIQTGILNGFTRSTILLIDNSDADIWVASREMVHFELTQPLQMGQVVQAQQVEGVARAEAISLQNARWISPTGEIAPTRIVGYDPQGQLFRLSNLVAGNESDLSQPHTIIIDDSNKQNLGLQNIGDVGKVSSIPTTLVGLTQGTQSMASSTFVFTSLENAKAFATAGLTSSVQCTRRPDGSLDCTTSYERLTPDAAEPEPTQPEPVALNTNDAITYVLVKAQPGQDLPTLKQRLEDQLSDTRAYTKQEMISITRNYWQNRTGIGFVLGLGATVGVIVGMVIVGQILYSSVSDHLKEFGTLKAMGASDWVLYRVIIEQALWMSVLGYIPSMGVCLALGAWTFATQGIMILITPLTAVGIFGVTVVMCVGSALFAIQKVTHVDPAIVFKG